MDWRLYVHLYSSSRDQEMNLLWMRVVRLLKCWSIIHIYYNCSCDCNVIMLPKFWVTISTEFVYYCHYFEVDIVTGKCNFAWLIRISACKSATCMQFIHFIFKLLSKIEIKLCNWKRLHFNAELTIAIDIHTKTIIICIFGAYFSQKMFHVKSKGTFFC